MTTASTSTPRPSSPGAVATPGGAAASAAPGTGSHTAASSTPAACAAAAMCRRPMRPAPATARRIGLERSKRVAYAVMPIRVASAPCSYGVFEITVGRARAPGRHRAGAGHGRGRIRRHRARAAGLLRPGPGGRPDARRARPRAHGLVPAAALLATGRLRGGPGGDGGRRSTRSTPRRPAARKPFVLLADAFLEPDRLQHAGDIEAHPETWLPPDRAELLVANLERAAARCRERGFPVSLHYHAGTYVETPREIAQVVSAIDTDLIGLCFDTGHTAFGGGDPLGFLKEYGGLVNHVHLKDVDTEPDGRGARRGRRPGRGLGARRLLPARRGRRPRRRVPRRAPAARLRRLDRRRAGSRARPGRAVLARRRRRPARTAPTWRSAGCDDEPPTSVGAAASTGSAPAACSRWSPAITATRFGSPSRAAASRRPRGPRSPRSRPRSWPRWRPPRPAS